MGKKEKEASQKYDIFSLLSFILGIIAILSFVLWDYGLKASQFNILVFTIGGLHPIWGPLAVLFGFTGEKRIKKYGYKGKKFYLAGLILGFIAIIILIISYLTYTFQSTK